MSSRKRVVAVTDVRPSTTASSEEDSPVRKTVAKSRRASSQGRKSTRSSVSARSRVRRPTPMVRVSGRAANRIDEADEEAQVAYNNDGRQIRASLTTRRNSDGLRWYDRLIPEFMLNMTAPITGYERQVESDYEDDDEFEILERQRLRRNRRIRRRLLALVIAAAAATAFFYSKGKLPKKNGVQAAVSSVAQRIEDGISKKINL